MCVIVCFVSDVRTGDFAAKCSPCLLTVSRTVVCESKGGCCKPLKLLLLLWPLLMVGGKLNPHAQHVLQYVHETNLNMENSNDMYVPSIISARKSSRGNVVNIECHRIAYIWVAVIGFDCCRFWPCPIPRETITPGISAFITYLQFKCKYSNK